MDGRAFLLADSPATGNLIIPISCIPIQIKPLEGKISLENHHSKGQRIKTLIDAELPAELYNRM